MNFSLNIEIKPNYQYVDVDSNLTDKQFSDKYLSRRLTVKQKMELYNSVMNNDLELFKSLIFGTPNRPPYDIFEEVSAPNFGWTPFHYAMHYGKLEIIKFIIAYLYSQNKIAIAFKLKSNDGRCPLLCLLKSSALTAEVKLDVFNKIVTTFSIPISDEVKKRLEVEKGKAQANLAQSNNNIPKPYPDHPYITNFLTKDEKMVFYNAAIKNNLYLFKSLIYGSPNQRPYPIFEEVSAPRFYWTVFHYAMHYGIWDIIKFIFEYLYPLNLVEVALNLKTNDNRCPLLCLLKSNNIKTDIKKDVFNKIISTFPIPVNDEVRKELQKRNFNEILQRLGPSY